MSKKTVSEIILEITEDNCEQMAAELFRDTKVEMQIKVPWWFELKIRALFLKEIFFIIVHQIKKTLKGE